MNDAQKANYEKRYVAFLDILGFREAVKKSTAHDQTLFSIINALHSIRPQPDHIYKITTIPSTLPPPKFGASVFSDSIIIYDEFSLAGLYRTINNITQVTEQLAIYGMLARGSLTCGLLHAANSPSNQPVVFGPALVQAVDLEKVARHPRVILSADVYNEIWHYGIAMDSNYRDSVIIRDPDDGAAYISPMYGFRSLVCRDEPDLKQLGLDYLAAVAHSLMQNLRDAIDNPEHFKKQRWFTEQYNSIMRVAGRPELQINEFTAHWLGHATEDQ
ncbi:hypothetical protein [Ferrovibrio sp.]|uniref:hypothetical protein n=1 Tax=Ferrovibrio sp. TaxID=1917215 RepID=UPI0025C00851|nr:hypothetical protein [Ferrovibrio sp.]MBX3454087.1 hypothetical protein [Ferrovibrio sp.]